MKRAKDNPLRGGRIMGKKQVLAAGLIARTMEWVIDELTGVETDPRKIEANCEKTEAGFREARRQTRASSTLGAVEEAKKLMAHYRHWEHEKRGWQLACASLGISVRTGDNLLVLLDFWKHHREIFDKVAPLGRTKVYHLARLPEKTLAELNPKKVVTVGSRTCRIKQLTDRQLLAYLRTIAPVPQRKRRSGLRRHLLKSLEIVDDRVLISAYTKPQLDFAVRKTQELFGKLKKAHENAA